MKIVLTGGFLGSGKTTAIVNASLQLMARGAKVAVITNDQGNQQVDSAFLSRSGIATAEVANGCFCCKYEEFLDRVRLLGRDAVPDYIFAEAVGSCTDIVATIAKPLKASGHDLEVMICVFMDAELIAAIIENRASFIKESIRYIFKKQLEEADVLILNKIDLVVDTEAAKICQVLLSEFPQKVLLSQDSNNQDDIFKWIDVIHKFEDVAPRRSLNIDYNIYAEGEAELTWCDEELLIKSATANAVEIAGNIMRDMFHTLHGRRLVIGHLKFFVQVGNASQKISFTTSTISPSFTLDIPESTESKLLVNARVQTSPQRIQDLFDAVVARTEFTYGCTVTKGRSSVFRPSFPRPTHRFAT
jgi:G3E family GTPase